VDYCLITTGSSHFCVTAYIGLEIGPKDPMTSSMSSNNFERKLRGLCDARQMLSSGGSVTRGENGYWEGGRV